MKTAAAQRLQSGERLVEFIANHSLSMPIPLALVIVFMAVVAANRAPAWQVLAWVVLEFAVLYGRYRMLSSLPARQDLSLERKLRVVMWLSGLSGLAHALSMLFFPVLSEPERFLFTLMLLGLATAAVGFLGGDRPTLVAHLLPIMGGLVLVWALVPWVQAPVWTERALSLIIGVYAWLLLRFAQETQKTFTDSWRIRLHEHELNEKLRQALVQAREASAAKTRFLAAASHDLRQPLHSLSLLATTLAMRQLDPRSAQIVELLRQSTDALASQLDGLLDVSKLDAGIVAPNLQPIMLRQLVLQHCQEIETAIRQKGLVPRFSFEGDDWVRTDANLLLRVLGNLTHNALKFTPGGHISVEVGHQQGLACVRIRDTGVGIAQAEQEKVFQEFYQVGNHERDRAKGLGLGLAIVQRLVDLLGIRMSMTSRPGQGTSFELLLPVVPAPVLVLVLGPQSEAQRQDERFDLNVLLVDDESSVRTSVRLLLEELGCVCREAADTREAVRVVQHARPDLVLADFRLREGDNGIATIRAVQNRWPGVCAVLVSGDTAPDRLREAQAAGINLLHKPVRLEQLQRELVVALAARDAAKPGAAAVVAPA
jgi:signal transduction histidine kinase/ActR/RegA family two-component response regulator